mmetsp:Transcript_50271/g.129622  ORF Transcript_50271/g.129622 Transcript_50271/m.129622 type:complete len:285 (-) Transcript_50271:45-899(-)
MCSESFKGYPQTPIPITKICHKSAWPAHDVASCSPVPEMLPKQVLNNLCDYSRLLLGFTFTSCRRLGPNGTLKNTSIFESSELRLFTTPQRTEGFGGLGFCRGASIKKAFKIDGIELKANNHRDVAGTCASVALAHDEARHGARAAVAEALTEDSDQAPGKLRCLWCIRWRHGRKNGRLLGFAHRWAQSSGAERCSANREVPLQGRRCCLLAKDCFVGIGFGVENAQTTLGLPADLADEWPQSPQEIEKAVCVIKVRPTCLGLLSCQELPCGLAECKLLLGPIS